MPESRLLPGSHRWPVSAGRRITGRSRSGFGRPEIGDRQLQVALAVPGVLLERKREVDRGAMLGHEASRSTARQAMPRMTRPSCLNAIFRWRSFDPARAVDDLHAAGAEDRTRVAGAERRQRRQLRRPPAR